MKFLTRISASSLFLFLGLVTACTTSTEKRPDVTTEAPSPEIVASHTAGLAISRHSPVRVLFVSEMVDASKVGLPLDTSPLQLDPTVAGDAVWASPWELVFTPAKPLLSDQQYRATVSIPGMQLGASSAHFEFVFSVVKRGFWVTVDGIKVDATEPLGQVVSGLVKTADTVSIQAVESMLSVKHPESDAISVVWAHTDGSLEHAFEINGVTRGETPTKLSLHFSGDAIGVQGDKDVVIEIAPVGRFDVTSATAIVTGDKHAEIRFSDPLDPRQDLRGRLRIDGVDGLRFTIDGNILKVYSSQNLKGAHNIRIDGVKNIAGKVLEASVVKQVVFETPKPAVSFVGDGVILPTTDGLTVPIEVTNVHGVLVTATRVYESNVPQFLQVNRLGGTSQMQRVGKVVWEKHFPIEMGSGRLNRPVRIGLDLSELVKTEPSALLHLSLRLLPSDVLADCPDGGVERFPGANWDDPAAENSLWDMFDWSERRDNANDPCHPAFYTSDQVTDARNVLVTDLGIIAKKGVGDTLQTVVTHLSSAMPLPQIQLRALDYQFQEVSSAVTDKEGRATLSSASDVFLVEASGLGQKSWLKLDRGSALSVSHFDVSGAAIKDGLKGVIYGERGVWRPGDTMFLTFVLKSTDAVTIPENHPINFKLRGPRGGVVDSQTITKSLGGFYAIESTTPIDGDTGNYTATVKVGGAEFSRSLLVETVQPNRLKIVLDLDDEVVKAPEMKLAGTLNSRWLHGAKSPRFKADIKARFRPTKTTFAGYGDYTFDDVAAVFDGSSQTVYAGYLNDEGTTLLDVPIKIGAGAPGMLKATLQTRVFEPSGAFSINKKSVTLSPYQQYVGVKTPKGDVARGMLLTDQPHTMQIALVDDAGVPVPSGEVELSLHKINWRWWWEQGEESLADFNHSYGHRLIKEGTARITKGKAEWEIEVKYPDWGRYLLVAKDTKGGHRTTKVVYLDWPGWAGRAQDDRPGGSGVLSLSVDNSSVSVGETVTVSFPSAPDARALVSLENGSQVVHSAWVEPQGETTQYTFTVTKDMVPNIYAHVTLIQPHMSTRNDRPIRMYGITPIEVVDPATKLSPTIVVADSFEPESTNTVKVSESNGRAMTYTVAVVDEGLLGLTGFKTPNPWDTFFMREALGVSTWDLFSMVSGSYGGVLESLLAIGGGDEGEDREPAKANRFEPVVQYLGPFTLAAGETASHQVDIPSYIGEVRVMVVAGDGAAYGSSEIAVPVKKPLMLMATLPRVARPGEEVALPVSVFVLDEGIKKVNVKLEIEGAAELISPSGPKRSLHFSATGDQIVNFRVRMGEVSGPVQFKVSAKSGKHRAETVTRMEVALPGSPISRSSVGEIAPGGKWRGTVPLVGASPKVTLEVSTVPPLDLERNLSALIRYPHGCVEQTTSSVFPQVAITQLMELSPDQQKKIQSNVVAGINRLRGFQTSAGGFAYWPGEVSTNDWASSYVGHFLVEAERSGYHIPADTRARWVAYQQRSANNWVRHGDRSDLIQAYRLYTLALSGSGDLGAMNRLRDLSISSTAQWRLAATYHLVGQTSIAAEMTANLSTVVDERRELSGTYGSGLRDQAMMLQVMTAIGDRRAAEMAVLVSNRLSKDQLASTHTTAFSLVALADFAGQTASSTSTVFDWSLNGGPSQQVSKAVSMVSVDLPIEAGKPPPALLVRNTGTDKLWVRAISSGVPKLGQEKNRANGLDVDWRYLTVKGKPLDTINLRQGTDFVVEVKVKNLTGRRLEEVALTQLFASGWEIHGITSGTGANYDYRAVKDDRVYTYFDLEPRAVKTFKVPLNATYLGKFYRFAPQAEAMYDASIHAGDLGAWVNVVDLADQG